MEIFFLFRDYFFTYINKPFYFEEKLTRLQDFELYTNT